jgi:hypothetical protein
MRGIRSKNDCYIWVPCEEHQISEQDIMLSRTLKHHMSCKVHNLSYLENLNKLKRIFLEDNHFYKRDHLIRNPIKQKYTSTKDPLFLFAYTKILNKRDKIDFLLQEKLWQLIYEERASFLSGARYFRRFSFSTPN